MECILRRFPEYIKVKDLPHDDMTYKVNHFHFLSLRFSLVACYNVFIFSWRSNFIVTVPCFAYVFFFQIDLVTLLYEKGILVRK